MGKVNIILSTLFLMLLSGSVFGQKTDTITINFGKESKLVLIIKDRNDINSLIEYDLNAILKDIKVKLDTVNGESRMVNVSEEENKKYLKDTTIVVEHTPIETTVAIGDSSAVAANTPTPLETGNEVNQEALSEEDTKKKHYKTRHSINFDLGINQILEEGQFPDANNAPYTVRPWGSWYVGIHSVNRFHFGGRFFGELGIGVDWYNFKFQDHSIRINKTDDGLEWVQDTEPNRDFVKSKLTAAYLSASLVPIIHLGRSYGNRKSRFYDSKHRYGTGVRIGFGAYASYRVDSYTKYVYRENGSKQKDRSKDNYYLDNQRYGLRFQLGIRSTDLFVNYDLNHLFYEGKGPKLNAFSFGVTF